MNITYMKIFWTLFATTWSGSSRKRRKRGCNWTQTQVGYHIVKLATPNCSTQVSHLVTTLYSNCLKIQFILALKSIRVRCLQGLLPRSFKRKASLKPFHITCVVRVNLELLAQCTTSLQLNIINQVLKHQQMQIFYQSRGHPKGSNVSSTVTTLVTMIFRKF